jgi:hypothetical protein
MGTRTSIKASSPGRERTVTSPPALRARARIPIIPRGPAGLRVESGGEAAVVVLNGEADRGVARHVCQRLPGNAKQVRPGLIGKAAGASGCESRLDADARGETLDEEARA